MTEVQHQLALFRELIQVHKEIMLLLIAAIEQTRGEQNASQEL
ncbi:hypothetical protein BJ970_003096 [Saccharopolyspora phatthalungensis]|uniref:Uncharacterized protein n=1 Tax=Saccharopolyspora phatthalungensis TaxID=664693 RepID=A0A840PZ52_9PSEU|nr:hypothetical protein [Saccharopolyspora phatthalungensis]